jgi:AraC-like DNA-binding protein
MGEEVNAIALTRRVLEKSALSAEDRGFANILIALCHSHLGELDPALSRLSSVAMPLAILCPDSPLLAQVKWAQGLTYIRLYLYRRHVELFRGWPGMPEIKASLPSPEHVYALFDHAQSLIPNSRHWPYLDIGKLLAQGLMGPSPAAVEALRSISRRNLQVDPPLSARALFCQGLVLRRLGQPLEALATFDAALQCAKPLDSWSITRDATLHMSRIHEELGNPGEALESYKIYSDLRLRGLVNNADLESAYFGPLEAVKPHEQHHQLRSLDPIFVKRATSYILDNIDKRISIDDVVRHSGVSRRTLETAFKEAKSSSIGRFIKTHKIQRASADLSYTKMSVNALAGLAMTRPAAGTVAVSTRPPSARQRSPSAAQAPASRRSTCPGPLFPTPGSSLSSPSSAAPSSSPTCPTSRPAWPTRCRSSANSRSSRRRGCRRCCPSSRARCRRPARRPSRGRW